MQLLRRNGTPEPKAPIPMPPRPPAPAPRRPLSESAAHVAQDILDLQAENDRLRDDVAELQLALRQRTDELATSRKIMGDHITKLEVENEHLRAALDQKAERIATLHGKFDLLAKALLDVMSEEAPPKEREQAQARADALEIPALPKAATIGAAEPQPGEPQ